MALKLYIFSMFTVFILSFLMWLLLFSTVYPYIAPSWVIFLFYATFFMTLTSIFALISFYLKVSAGNREVIFSHIGPSIRQSAFISLTITLLLFFEQIKVLNWWIAGILCFAVLLFELFFRTKK